MGNLPHAEMLYKKYQNIIYLTFETIWPDLFACLKLVPLPFNISQIPTKVSKHTKPARRNS